MSHRDSAELRFLQELFDMLTYCSYFLLSQRSLSQRRAQFFEGVFMEDKVPLAGGTVANAPTCSRAVAVRQALASTSPTHSLVNTSPASQKNGSFSRKQLDIPVIFVLLGRRVHYSCRHDY